MPAADLGAWLHLCGVVDGTRYSIFRNGVLLPSSVESVKPPDYLFPGNIDDVRIDGRALSTAEVEALYRR